MKANKEEADYNNCQWQPYYKYENEPRNQNNIDERKGSQLKDRFRTSKRMSQQKYFTDQQQNNTTESDDR